MRHAICIDPGTRESALVVVAFDDSGPGTAPPWGISPRKAFEVPNEEVRGFLADLSPDTVMVIETIAAIYHGLARDQLEAERWGSRFGEMHRCFRIAAGDEEPLVLEVFRQTAKAATAGRAAGTDAEVRRAIIDAYGGEEAAMGVRCRTCKGKGWRGREHADCEQCAASGWEVPRGPLHGWTGSHKFAALALAFAALQPGGAFWERWAAA